MTGKQLMILAVIAGIFSGVAGYFALISSLADASGWLQVAIAFAGLPVFLYELDKIGENIERAQRKLEIEIGVAEHPLTISSISSEQPLSIQTRNANFYFALVLRNRGELAARFVKIFLEYKPNGDETDIRIRLADTKPGEGIVKTGLRKDFIFQGGVNWIIYPHDIESFLFEITEPKETGKYIFQCTVWAEGLDNPVKQELIVQTPEPPPERMPGT